MKNLQVIKIEANEKISLKNASLLLDNLTEINKIDCINWKEYPYRPRVEFRIGHGDNLLLLKFSVTEKSVRAMETEINGKVWEDSCVEFFISTDGQHYYNFEFNCIGTALVAWGNNRNNRQVIPVEIVRNILVKPSIGSLSFPVQTGDFTWELCVIIPATCFIHDMNLNFAGLSGNANFYKCGDQLQEPHFVTWNPVGTAQPDYHRPEFFGKIDFE